MQLCLKRRGGHGTELKTFRRGGQLLSYLQTTGHCECKFKCKQYIEWNMFLIAQ